MQIIISVPLGVRQVGGYTNDVTMQIKFHLKMYGNDENE